MDISSLQPAAVDRSVRVIVLNTYVDSLSFDTLQLGSIWLPYIRSPHSRSTAYNMHSTFLVGLAASFASQAYAACSGPLKIDDFSKYSANTNSLGSWTSGMRTRPLQKIRY